MQIWQCAGAADVPTVLRPVRLRQFRPWRRQNARSQYWPIYGTRECCSDHQLAVWSKWGVKKQAWLLLITTCTQAYLTPWGCPYLYARVPCGRHLIRRYDGRNGSSSAPCMSGRHPARLFHPPLHLRYSPPAWIKSIDKWDNLVQSRPIFPHRKLSHKKLAGNLLLVPMMVLGHLLDQVACWRHPTSARS